MALTPGLIRNPISPERALWASVLVQAIRDLMIATRDDGSYTRSDIEAAHNSARAFFRGGDDLRTVCDLAGVSYDKVVALYRSGRLEEVAKACGVRSVTG